MVVREARRRGVAHVIITHATGHRLGATGLISETASSLLASATNSAMMRAMGWRRISAAPRDSWPD